MHRPIRNVAMRRAGWAVGYFATDGSYCVTEIASMLEPGQGGTGASRCWAFPPRAGAPNANEAISLSAFGDRMILTVGFKQAQVYELEPQRAAVREIRASTALLQQLSLKSDSSNFVGMPTVLLDDSTIVQVWADLRSDQRRITTYHVAGVFARQTTIDAPVGFGAISHNGRWVAGVRDIGRLELVIYRRADSR